MPELPKLKVIHFDSYEELQEWVKRNPPTQDVPVPRAEFLELLAALGEMFPARIRVDPMGAINGIQAGRVGHALKRLEETMNAWPDELIESRKVYPLKGEEE